MTQVATPNRQFSTPAALGWSRLPAAYAIPATAPSLDEAREYCARLARTQNDGYDRPNIFVARSDSIVGTKNRGQFEEAST